MVSWPISLQQSLNSDDFDLKFGDTTVRTDMDVGPAKIRSRYTDAVDNYTISILMTLDQFQDLKDFYRTELNNGVMPFQFTDPMTNTLEVFRFTSPPEFKPLGGLVFRVSMTWEKLP